ncbi:dephospho-CoA kinase [Lampropedia aestuarii]|uniref:dephospho-CoA kinase n=1 Tax=Lampropedia aestuarii TaxID=2562762 RepID=UPI002468E805|nr:dephospho-CoA kinase [Lampropedia aestuarii]MDH5858475.1 dephospho-CoA kinase [Lampropedia aestuarii]
MTPLNSAPKLLIGLTGGIGSGKSTVAAFLAQHFELKLVDADHISRGLTAPNGAAIAAIAAAFGQEFIDANGGMDRDRMRQLVFEQPSQKAKLEGIVHPLIFHAIDAAQQQAFAQGAQAVVVDIPLLVESVHWRTRLDRILVVDCPVELQIQRVEQRSQLPRAQIERIILSQASRATRLACADTVIYNAGLSLAQLQSTTQAAGRHFRLTAC